MEDEVKSSYFNQVVRDGIHELKLGRQAFCFNEEQLHEIAGKFDAIEYKLVDGIYYITLPKKVKNEK